MSARELARRNAGAGHAAVDAQAHLAARRHRLEGRDLDRAQLRLALVAPVDAALDDHDRVLDEVLAARAVDLAEDDDLDLRHAVVEAREGHRVAAARGRHAQRRDQSRRRRPSRARAGRPGRAAAGRHGGAAGRRTSASGWIGEVQPERLLLEREQLLALELGPEPPRMVPLRLLLDRLPPRSKIEAWPAQRVGLRLLPGRGGRLERGKHRAAGRAAWSRGRRT